MIALQGPKAAEYLTRLKGFNVEAIASLKKMRVTILGDMYVARSGYTGEDGFEIFAPKTNAISIWKELAAMGVVKCGLGARDVLRIEAAFPLYGHEITAELSPFDADLGRYVDMNKNDFAGKKALQTRPIKYKRVLFSVAESIPRQGFEIILENKVVGLVTSGTLCAKLNRGVGLGLIEEGYSFSENSLMIKIRNRETAAKIHSKNFLQ
jgi:aminomethyltransferase